MKFKFKGFSKIAIIICLSVIMLLGIFGCKKTETVSNVVRMSVLYTTTDTRMRMGNTYAPYTSLCNNETYQVNSLKPAWVQLQKDLDFTIRDSTPERAVSVSDAFNLLSATGFATTNILSGTASQIVNEGTSNGTLVDLSKYLDKLPNFAKFLNENEIVKKSITSDNGAIYYSPYFDGFDDIETMFICRTDWVEKLLDGTDTNFDTAKTMTTYYNAYYNTMDTTFKVAKAEVDLNLSAAENTQTVTVRYNDNEGIIDLQNALTLKNGENLTKTLKTYLKKLYLDTGVVTKLSDVYCGQNACYNADELIALWRCVYTNPELLTGDDTADIIPFYPRSTTVDRTNAVIQLAQIWGVRGYDSRSSYFFIDQNGQLQDSRTTTDRLDSLEYLNQLYKEGLICHNYDKGISGGTQELRDYLNKNGLGFMTYDYNQTTTIYNDTQKDSTLVGVKGLKLSPIMFPVADWDNQATGNVSTGFSVTGADKLYQYTESWRSVKTEGWCITSATTKNTALFEKCLAIFDYMYTENGQRLMTYGPDEWIKHDEAGNIVYMDYYGRQVPVISDSALTELRDKNKGQGNYTNYYRYYVGSTMPIGFVKEQGMEYQTVDPVGLTGLKYIENARKIGTLQNASVVRNSQKPQNSLVPTTFALSKATSDSLNNNCATLGTKFNNSSAAGENVFHNYIMYGFNNSNTGNTNTNTLTREGLVELINVTWKCDTFVSAYRNAYAKMYL